MPLFSRFKNKGTTPVSKSHTANGELGNGLPKPPYVPRWQATWSSKTVDLAEVEELVHACTAEMKLRAEALDAPFLLLPFRLDSDPSSARSFIRDYYKYNAEGSDQYRGAGLRQELRLTEPGVLCSIVKWCWSRLPGGVVTWPIYEGFRIGELESHMARNAFDTFIPISADSPARRNIIFDFFDLLAAVAAHGKMNGLGGRKLSRMAGWWAFDHSDNGKGFEGGYQSWSTAADASSHLFFAYLRSLSPEAHPSMSVIERIPRSLQALLASTDYPPEPPTLLQRTTPKVLMLVDTVSPTPFALLRRAKHFEYRENDRVLREYSDFDDPLDALTEENKRVLYAISTTNSSAAVSRHGNVAKTGQEVWSDFQNLGFSDLDAKPAYPTKTNGINGRAPSPGQGLRSQPRSRQNDYARPTTPSWADFLSSGFVDDDAQSPSRHLLPPDKVLPPIGSRSQTPLHSSNGDDSLAPGELAAITSVELDDAFWWVWMTSLASEEPADRKAVFGRCALVETSIMGGQWLIMEEQVKGASPDPVDDAYIAPKKGIFSFTKRNRNKVSRNDRSRTNGATQDLPSLTPATPSKTSLAPDQQSKIKAAAAALAQKQGVNDADAAQRRGRNDDAASVKTSSMMTVGMMNDASPAMKWASNYDKHAVRAQYLGDSFAGRGMSRDDLSNRASTINMARDQRASTIDPPAPALAADANTFPADVVEERALPSVPPERPEHRVVPEVQEPSLPPEAPKQVPETNVVPTESEEVQRMAEETPLPQPKSESSTAFDKEMAVDEPSSPRRRKPVPRSQNIQEHPAFRQKNNEMTMEEFFRSAPPPQQSAPQNDAAIAAQGAMGVGRPGSTSPESAQASHAKLKKQAGGGGFKKLFGRKKDNPNRQSMDVVASQNSLAPPSESNFGRRLSLLRKKSPKSSSPGVAQQPPAHAAGHNAAGEPTLPTSPPAYEDVNDTVSHAATEDADPVQEFSRFDQGPMEDMPSAPPRESYIDGDYDNSTSTVPDSHPSAAHQYDTAIAARIAPSRQQTDHETFATPWEPSTPTHDDADDVDFPTDDIHSETTMDEAQHLPQTTYGQVPQREHRAATTSSQDTDVDAAKDRWATIRENAARRAARASEEQSTQSRPSQSVARETDDGETSGEETIESRVARIKARVAELTGGMDNGAAANPRR